MYSMTVWLHFFVSCASPRKLFANFRSLSRERSYPVCQDRNHTLYYSLLFEPRALTLGLQLDHVAGPSVLEPALKSYRFFFLSLLNLDD